jgi:hypothetical protein
MGSKVLGRIVSVGDGPRGPDVQMNLSVPEDWILTGATLEIELPRNLACASCGGGGCDACERSGAVSLRGRNDPVESVEVTLQSSSVSDDVPSSRTRRIVVRIPERGGHAPLGGSAPVPRGNLLLSVRAGPAPPRGVKRLAGPSIPPEQAGDAPAAETAMAPTPQESPWWLWPLVAGVVALLLFGWLLFRR